MSGFAIILWVYGVSLSGMAIFVLAVFVWNFWRRVLAWKTVVDLGVWRYQENKITGQRRALRIGTGYSPRCIGWLQGHGSLYDRPIGNFDPPQGRGNTGHDPR